MRRTIDTATHRDAEPAVGDRRTPGPAVSGGVSRGSESCCVLIQASKKGLALFSGQKIEESGHRKQECIRISMVQIAARLHNQNAAHPVELACPVPAPSPIPLPLVPFLPGSSQKVIDDARAGITLVLSPPDLHHPDSGAHSESGSKDQCALLPAAQIQAAVV